MWKKNFLFILIFTTLILLSVGIFNRIIDPYSIYTDKIDYSKNAIGSHLRLFKSVAIRKQKADILLFGDSQVEHGIDPDTLEKITHQTVFNASFMSMRIYEFRKYLELALQYHKPKTIIYGTQMYNYGGKIKFTDDYDEQYLDKHYTAYSKILSEDMLLESIKVIKQLSTDQQAERGDKGLWHDFSENPCHERFLANEKHYIFDAAPKIQFFQYNDGSSTFDELSKIIRICHDNDIKLIIFISPSHARQFEATAVGNGWNTFEHWKRELVSSNEKIAVEKNKKPFIIFDFSGYNNLTSETVPDKLDKTSKMQFYYESSHYKPALGNIVLDRIFNSNLSGGKNYPTFGVQLTNQNIESHLKKLRVEREIWRLKHPSDVKEIEAFKTKLSV